MPDVLSENKLVNCSILFDSIFCVIKLHFFAAGLRDLIGTNKIIFLCVH